MRPKPICVIGRKSTGGWNKADIIRYLKREQEKNKPAWFDGSFFYFSSGKYELVSDNRGRPSIKKLHNLSLDGIFNHFPDLPCEYIAYNQRAEEIAHKRWEADRIKELERANKESQRKAQAEKEDQQIQELVAIIENWIAKNPVKLKKGVFQIHEHLGKSKGTLARDTEGKIVENLLAIHQPTELTGQWKYRVSHVLTGGTVRDFASEKDCRRFIQSVIHLMDWNFENPDDAKKLPVLVIMGLASYCQHNPVSRDRLELIVGAINHKQQSAIK